MVNSGLKGLISRLTCLNRRYWEQNASLYIKICKCLGSIETKMSNFHPLEVVGRVSETQLQVGENLNYNDFIRRLKGQRN